MNSTLCSSMWVSFPVYASLSPVDLSLLALFLLLYFIGLMVALLVVAVIVSDTSLHRPPYVLLAHLSLSGVLGGSSLCPTLIRFLVLGEMRSSLVECLTQVFFANLYSGCIFCLLGLMALDRYVSICFPLQYHAVVTPARLRATLLCIYALLLLMSVLQVYLTSQIRLCRFAVDKLMCDSLALSSLACERTYVVSAFGLFTSFSAIIFPSFLIVLSYIHILIIVVKTSKNSQRKAFKTCMPHLITFTNFSMASLFGLISRRVNESVQPTVNIVVSLVFLVFPPLLNPIIYGIKMKEIQRSIRKTHRIHMAHVRKTIHTCIAHVQKPLHTHTSHA